MRYALILGCLLLCPVTAHAENFQVQSGTWTVLPNVGTNIIMSVSADGLTGTGVGLGGPLQVGSSHIAVPGSTITGLNSVLAGELGSWTLAGETYLTCGSCITFTAMYVTPFLSLVVEPFTIPASIQDGTIVNASATLEGHLQFCRTQFDCFGHTITGQGVATLTYDLDTFFPSATAHLDAFSVTFVPVPEPSSFALAFAGIGILMARWACWQSSH